MATEYLDAWKDAGLEPEDSEIDALYSLNLSAQRYGEALALELPLVRDEGLALNLRAVAAGRASSILRNYRMAEALGKETEAGAVADLEALLALLDGDEHAAARGTIHSALAAHAGRSDDDEGEIRHLMLAAEATPATAGATGRSIVRILQGRAHDLEGYDAVRAEAETLLPTLRELAAAQLADVKAGGDEAQIKRAESAVTLLDTVDRPLKMLGEPANAWTLEHAFGDVEEPRRPRGQGRRPRLLGDLVSVVHQELPGRPGPARGLRGQGPGRGRRDGQRERGLRAAL